MTGSEAWVGVDPGGRGSYGIARLYSDGKFETRVVSHTDEALRWITTPPLAVGIDSPMWWSSGTSGDRQADRFLRSRYKIASGTVQAANSLRGAALIQGHLFAMRVRERYPGTPVTESHPKALLLALKLVGWLSIASAFNLVGEEPNELHERDALLGAVAAREGFGGRWTLNLALERLPSEQNPLHLGIGEVAYYWPADPR